MNTITLGMTGFKDGNGINAIICSVNGANSPLLKFSDFQVGTTNRSTLGGYFQIVNEIGSDTLTCRGHFGLAWR
jgi:hypothetical protein